MTEKLTIVEQALAQARNDINLACAEDQQNLLRLSESLSSTPLHYCKELAQLPTTPLAFKIATLLAESRAVITNLNHPLKVGIVFAMWGEQNRLQPVSSSNPNGEDALRVKIEQLDWLFSASSVEWTLYAVDDGCPQHSGAIARSIAAEHTLGHQVRVLDLAKALPASEGALVGLTNANESRKGGAVILGCEQAIEEGVDVIVYTDADNSVHLGQLGLLLNPYVQGSGIVLGNRKDPGSVLVKQEARWGPGIVLLRHMQRMVGEAVFATGIKDTQAAFKLFDRQCLQEILNARTVFDFSFDTDWLLAAIANDKPFTTCPFAFVDSAAESASITQGPMSTWECLLKGLVKQVRKHRVPTNDAMCLVIDQELENVADFEAIIDSIPPQLTDLNDGEIGDPKVMSPEEIRQWISEQKRLVRQVA